MVVSEGLRVTVVHDCALTRRAIAAELSGHPGITARVAGSPTDLDTDVLVVDVRQAGGGRLRLIHADHPDLRIVLLVRAGSGDTGRALDALLAGPVTGVLDAVPLASGRDARAVRAAVRTDLVPLLLALRVAAEPVTWCTPLPGPSELPGHAALTEAPAFRRLVIGSGRTGTADLVDLLAALPPDLPVPVTVAQQVPGGFETALAQRVLARSAVPVELAGDDLDETFRQAAARHGDGVLGVLLPGSGRCGVHGATAVRAAGGVVLAQAEEHGRPWGIPGAVAMAGQADRLVPREDVAAALTVLLAVALTPDAPAPTGRHAYDYLEVQPA